MSQSYNFISLFSGIGGLDAGLHSAGFQPLFCVEKDRHALATLKIWLSQQKIECNIDEDVTNIYPERLRTKLGLSKGELDLIAGGPPCQSFSSIGKKQSLADERGLLLFQMIRYAKAFMPRAVLIEQVRGLLSAACVEGVKGGVLKKLVGDLEELGYQVNHSILRAADYGVPQLRDRLFIIATLNKKFTFPLPTHIANADSNKSDRNIFHLLLKPYKTVGDVIKDLPQPVLKGEAENFPNHVDVTPARDRARINGVPEGECLAKQLHLPAEQRQRLNPKKDTTKFRRLAWDKPSLTLRGGEVFYHPYENRYLTPRECLRLHGFDDKRVLIGPIRGRCGTVKNLDQHRLVANAVPPPLAKVIGENIIEQILAQEKPRLVAKTL